VWAFLAVVGWGVGFTLFLLLASIIGSRLLVAPPPAPQQAPGWWGWLAPVGAGGLGLLAATGLATDAGVLGDLRGAVTLALTVLWGFAVWWALLAVRVISREHAGLRFHVGWWAFGFPTAAFASLTTEVARLWRLDGLAAAAPVLWGALVILIVALGALTARGIRSGAVWAR
jgi:tellurite resistance protein TehA-like permease